LIKCVQPKPTAEEKQVPNYLERLNFTGILDNQVNVLSVFVQLYLSDLVEFVEEHRGIGIKGTLNKFLK